MTKKLYCPIPRPFLQWKRVHPSPSYPTPYTLGSRAASILATWPSSHRNPHPVSARGSISSSFKWSANLDCSRLYKIVDAEQLYWTVQFICCRHSPSTSNIVGLLVCSIFSAWENLRKNIKKHVSKLSHTNVPTDKMDGDMCVMLFAPVLGFLLFFLFFSSYFVFLFGDIFHFACERILCSFCILLVRFKIIQY